MSLYNDIELVVKKSKALEGRLKRELGAEGKGLGELTDNVKGKLPNKTYQQLRKVSEMRNPIVHEEGKDLLKDRHHFVQLCNRINRSLDNPGNPGVVRRRDWGCLVMAIIIVAPIIWLMLHPL